MTQSNDPTGSVITTANLLPNPMTLGRLGFHYRLTKVDGVDLNVTEPGGNPGGLVVEDVRPATLPDMPENDDQFNVVYVTVWGRTEMHSLLLNPGTQVEYTVHRTYVKQVDPTTGQIEEVAR